MDERYKVSHRLAILGWRCNGKKPDGPEVAAYMRMRRAILRVLGYDKARWIYADALALERRWYLVGPTLETPFAWRNRQTM